MYLKLYNMSFDCSEPELKDRNIHKWNKNGQIRKISVVLSDTNDECKMTVIRHQSDTQTSAV